MRFRPSERHLHWAIAIPFMVDFATALVLFIVYNPHPTWPYRQVFSIAHRVAGLCLIVCPALVFLRHRRDFRIHLYNIRQGWVWTFNDVKWLCLMGLAALSSRVTLPEQGKFNAAEKLNFMMVMTFTPLLILSGVLIWMPGADLWAWFAHIAMVAIATPLMLGHIYMATINPETRIGLQGMISGWVDRQWAKHHYRQWYRQNFEDVAAQSPGRRGESVHGSMTAAQRHAGRSIPAARGASEPDPLVPSADDATTRTGGFGALDVSLPGNVTS